MTRNWKCALGFGLSLLLVSEAVAETTWNVSLWGKRRAFTEGVHRLAELVEERSNGEFRLNISYGGLSKPRENLDNISVGAFEMAQVCILYHPDKTPMYTAVDLPFLGIRNIRQQGAFETVMQKHPALAADLARWNAVALMPSPQAQYNLAGTGAPIASPSDFSGKRIRSSGPIGEAFAKLGAVPTALSAPETYNALSSGVVDAVAFAVHAHLSYRTGEISDWWTENLNPGTANCPTVVNTDALESLTKEHRDILLAAVPDAMEHYYVSYEQAIRDWEDFMGKEDIARIKFSDADLAAMKETVLPLHQEWIEAQTAAGRPGREVYDAVMEAVSSTAGE